LQLIECIELIKSDVKKKMMLTHAGDRTPKSPEIVAEEVFANAGNVNKFSSLGNPIVPFQVFPLRQN